MLMDYKQFKTWEEAKNYSYPKESKSNYYAFIPETEASLPKPSNCQRGETPWKICQAPEKQPGIYIEITPLWVTITIQKTNKSIKKDISRKNRNVSIILSEAFK